MDNTDYLYTGNDNLTGAYQVNGLNQYTSVAGTAYTYDANGNLTSDGASTYVYDSQNRMTSVSGAKSGTLSYDPYGRLYQVVSNGVTTRFAYDGDALVQELNGSKTRHQNLHGQGTGYRRPTALLGASSKPQHLSRLV